MSTSQHPNSKKHKIQNWYSDRYFSATLQRNFLFFFATITSIAMLISLIVIKNLYEQKSVDPYLIEVEKQTNVMAIVDNTTKQEYTAQEAIKEYFILQYLNAREGYKPQSLEENINLIRVFSSKSVFEDYQQTSSASQMLRFARDTIAKVKVKSISYVTDGRVEIRFTVEIFSQELAKTDLKSYILMLGFSFLSLELSQAEIRLNPLGFQVISYFLKEVKLFDDNKMTRT